MPVSSSAFCTVQHGCRPNFTHMLPQRWSLTAICLLLDGALRYSGARRRSRRHGRPAARRRAPSRTGPASARVLACGLCGSDVEKLGSAPAGTVLGHEVVAEVDGRRVALVHHLRCGECARCLAGHESTCEAFRGATIRARRVRRAGADATAGSSCPTRSTTRAATMVEPLACVLRGAERRAARPRARRRQRASSGGSSRRCWSGAATRSSPSTATRAAPGASPDGPVDAAVLCAPGGADAALEAVEPGGTRARLRRRRAAARRAVYRRELTVRRLALGDPRLTWRRRPRSCPSSTLPEPTCLPLERFERGPRPLPAAARR